MDTMITLITQYTMTQLALPSLKFKVYRREPCE